MYRLLLVDNEKAVLDALVHALNWDELGFEVIDQAEDGMAAWEMARATHYDVVISDIRMPRMNGLELLQQIVQAKMDTRVIMLTAFDEFDYVLRALRLGASNYLMKPIDPTELRASVISALNAAVRQSAASSSADQQMFEEYFLRRWLLDGPECRDLDTRASLAGINIFLRAYNVLLLRGNLRPGSELPGKIRLLLGSVCEVWMLHDRPNEYVFVAGGRTVDEDSLLPLLESLIDSLKEEGAFLIVGQSVSSYTGVCDSYRSCLLAIESRSALPPQPLLAASEPPSDQEKAAAPESDNAISDLSCALADSSEKPDADMSPLIRRAVQLIRQQYAQPLSLGQIAQQLGTNANYLGFMFHQETGEYFSDYLNGIRIQEAQRLLRETAQPVGSIALSVGYSSVNYFCQVFKKITHQSPARYREQK